MTAGGELALVAEARSVVLLVTPGVVANWVVEAARVAALSAGGMPVMFADATTEIDASARPAIYVSSYPSASLLALALAAPERTLMVVEPALAVIGHLRQRAGCSLQEAIRFASASAAHLMAAAESGRLPILSAAALDRTRLTREIVLLINGARAAEALNAQEVARLFPAVPDGERAQAAGDEAATRVVLNVLSSIYTRLTGAGSQDLSIIWPWQVFYSGDSQAQLASAIADMTGGARILYYGPYFHLPAGRWTARIMLAFSADAVGMPVSIGIYSDQTLGEVMVRVQGAGVFAATVPMAVHDPARPIELRVATREGAIEGWVALGMAEFSPDS